MNETSKEARDALPTLAPHVLVQALLDARATHESLSGVLGTHAVDAFALLRYAGDCAVSGALAASVRRHAVAGALEPDLALVLEQVLAANAERNRALLDATARYADILARAGLRPIALKGAAMLAEGRYAEPGARMASDIDLLVAPAALADALVALRDAGCLQVGNRYLPGRDGRHGGDAGERRIDVDDFRNDPRHAFYHVPAIRHPALAHNLELHTGVTPPALPMGRWLNAAVLADAVPLDAPLDGPASPLRVPAPLPRLLHNFHHSQIKDRLGALGVSDWRHLLDARLLFEQLDDGTLEAGFRERAARHGLGAEAELHLWQLREWLGAPLSGRPPSAAGERRVRRFEATRTVPARRHLAGLAHFWRRRARDLFSPDQLRRYYGPVPYPVALGRALRFRAAGAWRLVRTRDARRLLSGR